MAFTPPGQTRERVYRMVRDRLLAGSPPTVREVQDAMGFQSVESARRHLDALVGEGRLRKTPGLARGYRLGEAGPARQTVWVPLLGQVQAGDLHSAIEDPDGYLPVEVQGGEQELFALRVRGDSMRDAGILPGDVVVVRRQPRAESGDIVVAMVDDEATVKTLHRRGRTVRLLPANPDYRPITPPGGKLQVLGKVIELRRRL